MTINGTPVNFAFASASGVAATALSGHLIQSAEHSADADAEDVRSGTGDKVTRGWYDQHLKATLEFVVSGTGIAAAKAATTLATYFIPGSFISITASADDPDLVGTNWEVASGASIVKGNTNAAKLRVPLERRAGITGAAPA